MADRALRPLRAETYVFLNHRNHSLLAATKSSLLRAIGRALAGVNVQAVDVEPQVQELAPCEGDQPHWGPFAGYRALRGLRQCFEAMAPRRYEWVVRLRSDTGLSVALDSLPAAPPLGAGVQGLAILGDVRQCECGSDTPARTPCHAARPLTPCQCATDQFALLHRRAIDAYMRAFAGAYCAAAPPTKQFATSAECRLGRVLHWHNVSVRDVRFVSVLAAPRLVRTPRDCGSRRAPWGGGVSATALRNLPIGPWDERRSAYCATARARRRRGEVGYPFCLRHPAYGAHDDDARCVACPIKVGSCQRGAACHALPGPTRALAFQAQKANVPCRDVRELA